MQRSLSSSENQSNIPMCEPFPYEGNVRVKQAAEHLGIGVSTFWSYVGASRIQRPIKYSKRMSVWSAKYIRELALHGIPEADQSV